MKRYLIDTFKYNDRANCKLLEVIRQLPDKEEAIKLFSHLISSQDKWMNRITTEVDDAALKWFGEKYSLEEIEGKWNNSVNAWIFLLENNDESFLENEVIFLRASDAKKLSVKIREIMTQLNYHSIHHRAQVNTLIRKQNLTPPATDYILSVLKEVN